MSRSRTSVPHLLNFPIQVGNAFFSLTIHALPAGWRKLVVVTSAFHMPRTQALFEDMSALAARDILKADPKRWAGRWDAPASLGTSQNLAEYYAHSIWRQ